MDQKSLAEKTKQMQREIILEQAARLFAEEGPKAVTMRKIAQKSKTSTMVLYSLFGNKSGVIEELFMEAYQVFQDKVLELDHNTDKFQFLLGMCELLWDFSKNRPNHYRMIHGNLFPGFHPSQMKDKVPAPRPQDIATDVVQRMIDGGHFKGMQAAEVIVSMYSMAMGLVNIHLNGLFPEMEINKEKFLTLLDTHLRAIANNEPENKK